MTKKLMRRESRQGLGGLGEGRRPLNANILKASRTFNIDDTWSKLTKWGPQGRGCPLRSVFFIVIQVYFFKGCFLLLGICFKNNSLRKTLHQMPSSGLVPPTLGPTWCGGDNV